MSFLECWRLNRCEIAMSGEQKQKQQQPHQHVKIPDAIKFAFGGLSGMGATLFVQPLDLVKNRMQLSGKYPYTITVT